MKDACVLYLQGTEMRNISLLSAILAANNKKIIFICITDENYFSWVSQMFFKAEIIKMRNKVKKCKSVVNEYIVSELGLKHMEPDSKSWVLFM